MGKTWGLVCLFSVLVCTTINADDSLSEWISIQKKINKAVSLVKRDFKRDGLRLGLGWWGNVSRMGPPCDEVAYRVEDALRDEFGSSKLEHYKIALLFDEGPLPKDLMAHVYFGVISKRSGRLLYCFDPWRYGNGRLREDCPNSPDEMHTFIE